MDELHLDAMGPNGLPLATEIAWLGFDNISGFTELRNGMQQNNLHDISTRYSASSTPYIRIREFTMRSNKKPTEKAFIEILVKQYFL